MQIHEVHAFFICRLFSLAFTSFDDSKVYCDPWTSCATILRAHITREIEFFGESERKIRAAAIAKKYAIAIYTIQWVVVLCNIHMYNDYESASIHMAWQSG